MTDETPVPPSADPLAPSANVVVRFRVPGPTQTAQGHHEVQRGAHVVVKTPRGIEMAAVLGPAAGLATASTPHSLLRDATPHDERMALRNREREAAAARHGRERIAALGLSMKLVGVEILHDGQQALFHFTSNERVDFRALVKELARHLHMRVEMRQIGVRDAARHTGGTGLCGRTLCCSTFLPEFKPISIRMAKDQNLPLNQNKLSGLCGRLRCCLQYEQSSYEEARKTLPKVGSKVTTPEGEGRVRDVNVLRRIVRVDLQKGGFAEFPANAVQAAPHSTAEAPAPDAAKKRRRRGKRPAPTGDK